MGFSAFKFCSLRQMYERQLQILGINKTVHKTFFKAKVLSYFFQCMYAQKHNDDIYEILVFEQGIQHMLKASMQSSDKEDIL